MPKEVILVIVAEKFAHANAESILLIENKTQAMEVLVHSDVTNSAASMT